MRILHITDFHIDSPNSSKENLRVGFYQEFIDSLANIIKINELGNIDLIVNTGDFVNIGKTENFYHAKTVLDYIVNKFGVSENDVALCLGNHDFKMKEPGSREQKIIPFNDFSKNYVPGEILGVTSRSKLYQHSNLDIQILIIDNSSREDEINEPCKLDVAEIDKIINLARDNSTKCENLMVLSHYPMIGFPMAKYTAENPDWPKNHIWSDGFNVQHRLAQIRLNGKTIFLCGDGHIPDAFTTGNNTFVMTGLFGGDYTKRATKDGSAIKSFHINTQARIIDFSFEKTELSTFNYKPTGFDYDIQIGKWEFEVSNIREVVDKQKNSNENISVSRTTVLSAPLEEQIINRIKKEKLYKLGRFITSEKYHSLSWVSINRLFEEQQILVSLIDKCIDWISKITSDESKNFIIGVDFWGSMIGVHLALRLNFKADCFSTKSFDHDNDLLPIENLVNSIIGITAIKNIIIVTDVVSSGVSVLKIITQIEESYLKIKGSKLDVKFHSISVISDSNIVRKDFDAKVTTVKTACGSLRMPISKSEDLPDQDILSSRIDLTS